MDTSAHFHFDLIGLNFDHAIETLGLTMLHKILIAP